MIKTLFFDIGNVLLNIYSEEVVRQFTRAIGVETTVMVSALFGEMHDDYEKGGLTDEQFFSGVMANIASEKELTQTEFFDCWRSMLGDVTETFHYARELSKTITVWLASNTNQHHINHGGVRNKMNGFSGAIYSFDVGARKPDECFFKAMLTAANANASESFFVDDRMENVAAAGKMGMTVIHYRSHGQFVKDFESLKLEIS